MQRFLHTAAALTVAGNYFRCSAFQLHSMRTSWMNKISGCALVCIPRAVLLWELVFQDRYAVAWAPAVMLRRCFATDPRYNHESSNLLHAAVHRKHAVQTFYYRQDPVVPTSYPTTTAIGGPGRGSLWPSLLSGVFGRPRARGARAKPAPVRQQKARSAGNVVASARCATVFRSCLAVAGARNLGAAAAKTLDTWCPNSGSRRARRSQAP